MVSVIIPLYNKAGQITRTLESVFAQTYTDFEIVIVDDGSTDDSARVVEALNDPRIRLIRQKNAGVSAARNRGIEEAKGEFVAVLDADDEWHPEYLQTQIMLSNRYQECDVYCTDYIMIDATGNIKKTVINKLAFNGEYGVLENYFEVASCSHPPICSISIMVRKGVIESIGGFPLGIKSGEDLLTWAKLAVSHKIAYVKRPLAIYYLGEGYDYSKLPPRRQDVDDPVGAGLKKLLRENPDIAGLKHYVSHWHKMRASVAIRYGERMETLAETMKSLRYNPMNYKVMMFVPLALVPSFIRKRIIGMKK